jgi:cytochrome c peroxidase
MPIFSLSEQKIIQSLSSRNYNDTPTTGNRLSGNAAAIKWGKALFFDKRLSGDGKIACASCHDPATGWGKHEAKTNLKEGYQAARHVPHLWNVRYNRWYFWDGRADSLWSQALMPIENKAEMASSRVQIATLIINTPALKQSYQQLFGEIPARLINANLPQAGKPNSALKKKNNNNDVDILDQQWQQLDTVIQADINTLFANIGKAIASFEETIISKDSAFYQFADQLLAQSNSSINLQKDSDKSESIQTTLQASSIKNAAISAQAAQGLKLFIGKAGCVNCHSGAHFSDHEFHQSFLKAINLKGDLGRYDAIDKLRNNPFNMSSRFYDNSAKGRGNQADNKLDYIYKNIAFRGQFKTPSLRNVANTYPYMHTGEFKTLDAVIEYYAHISKRTQANNHQEALLQSLPLSKDEQQYLVAFLQTLTGQAKISQPKRMCDL